MERCRCAAGIREPVPLHLNKILPAVLAALLCCTGAPIAAAEAPAPGCYERVYDAAHLAAHPGQLVVRATVLVKPFDASEAAALGPAFTTDAHLKMWVRGQKTNFNSFGACRPADGTLNCEGSLSAAEADACKTSNDGVHRDCRISAATCRRATRWPDGDDPAPAGAGSRAL